MTSKKGKVSKYALKLVYYCQSCKEYSGTSGTAKREFRVKHDHRTEYIRKEKPRK